ncbi:MAG TPA: HEAT repeat domain-containing protein [Vicinamibacterales bacterium]|nr:HEAT repeat domain-containing protein [Vicinamibacterales bacterium]
MAGTTDPREILTPDAAAAVTEFARGCKAAARAVSLYPPQHPAIAASLTRLVHATTSLTAEGPLDVQVRAQSLLVGGAAMPKPDQAVDELAELLHRHLIGALVVNAGADADSWRTLLLLLSRTPEEVRADGGIAHLWATAGGPSVEVREVDYAEVLREKQGSVVTIDRILAAAMDGPPLQLDDDGLQALLDVLGDPAQVDQLMARLDEAARGRGVDAKAAAVVKLLRSIAAQAQKDPRTFESALRQLGHVAARLSPDEMLQLLVHRAAPTPDGQAVGAVLDRMDDGDLAQFVAGSVIAERGATGRLAHAFQALVPDGDRQRQLLAIAQDRVAESDVGQEAGFEELWGRVESMVTSYSDANYVSEAYGRELFAAQTRAVDIERTNDDPPERIGAWLSTVNDSALRGLDHQLLLDLLAIEPDPTRWRDVVDAAAGHADDLVRVGYFDAAWGLADALIREGARMPGREAFLPAVLERFGRGSMMKHVAAHLRNADDEAYERFERLCRAIGTPVIAPLAEALSNEQDARSRRRLRDVLIGFGAQGRDVVQQLMSAPNWEVRRTAAFLLREFGGSEGLRELIPLLTDTEPLVQREAVQGLMLNGSDEAAAILLHALHSSSGRSRQTLVNELTGIRDRKAAPLFCYLVRHLNRSKHPHVYLSAIESLGTFGDPDSVTALKTALHQGEWWAPLRTRRSRAAAAGALRRIGTAPALDVLRGASASGNRGARAAARAELAQLG